jgi:hypothetical protein
MASRAARRATKHRAWASWFVQSFEETVEERGGHAGLRFELTQDFVCPIFGCGANEIADREVDQVSGEGDLGFAFPGRPDFETSYRCHCDSS